MKNISRLHFIATTAEAAEKACLGGVDWVQLRLKNCTHEEYKTTALQVQAVCRKYGATFLINDNVQLAKEIGADGVHIGKDDMHPVQARELLGPDFIIGCTANTIEDVLHLSTLPIDYLGLGPFRFTNTKKNLSPVLGIEGYVRIFEAIGQQTLIIPPIVGIGGIVQGDVANLLTTGLYGIAISGAIERSGNPTLAAQQFKEALYSIQLDQKPVKSKTPKNASILSILLSVAEIVAELIV